MILKGRCRADGGKLAEYLLSSKNERVSVLDIRGTIIDERSPQGLTQSLLDMDELGKMTRAKSSLFHLAINPDDRDRMTPEMWQQSVDKAEKALGLEDHPRAIVSHIYQGKEHYHVVWSRVDVEQRKCAEMSFSNRKLCSAAREIEIELGLQQTPERARGAHRLKQHIKDIQRQQDARTPETREERNAIVQGAWNQANNGAEFKEQMEVTGYRLGMGKRGVMIVDRQNEAHLVVRCLEDVKTKEVRSKFADLQNLPDVDEVRQREKGEAKTEETKTEKTTTGQQITERGARDIELKPAHEAPEMPKPIIREAQNITALHAERELVGSNDNAPPAKRPSESDEKYQARLKRWADYDKENAAKEPPKHEMHHRPKGPSFGR